MSTGPQIAFRVDASYELGIGHFMRCLTLARAIRRAGARVRFVSRELPEYLQRACAAIEVEHAALPAQPVSGTRSHRQMSDVAAVDAHDTLAALADSTWDWLVVDHYGLDVVWERALRRTARRLLVIDDLADRSHDCDVLVDQNFYAGMETRYVGKVPDACVVLVGPRYALLRDEFRELREQRMPAAASVQRILVNFGGTDTGNHTALAIEALAALTDRPAVDVVIGEQHGNRATIQAACAKYGFSCHIQSERIGELMAAADLAIGAGGSTTWERCCVGVPTFVRALADNQRQLVRDTAERGAIYAPDANEPAVDTAFIGRHLHALMENTGLRRSIARAGMALVDGRGVMRVLRHLDLTGITLRQAREQDSSQLFAWRNDASIRAVSRHHDPIDWTSHERWFQSVAADPQRALLIGERHGRDVGVVRLDIDHSQAEVSIYLVPGHTGHGTGGDLLHAAERWLRSSHPAVRELKAQVLGPNTVSHRLFAGGRYNVDYVAYRKVMC